MAVAWAKIICEKCGKTFNWRKDCANRQSADSAVEWAKNGGVTICPECYGEQMAEKRKKRIKEENEKADVLTQEYKLPELSGSEKQKTWANTIRISFLETCDELNKILVDNKETREKEFKEVIQNETEAKFWIDGRNKKLDDLIRDSIIERKENEIKDEYAEKIKNFPKINDSFRAKTRDKFFIRFLAYYKLSKGNINEDEINEIVEQRTEELFWFNIHKSIDFDNEKSGKIAFRKHKELEKRLEELGVKRPIAPEVLRGHVWNQRVYGKAGNYSVYLDKKQVMISDEQAKEIEEYLKQKKEYWEKTSIIRDELIFGE